MQTYDKKTGRFLKGMTPWNLGKHGYMGANETSFTKEKINAKGAKSVGIGRDYAGQSVCLTEERVLRPDPRRKDKVYAFRKRISTARFVLEKKLGRKLLNTEIVWHIDGNPHNNELSNLEIIDRAELARRNARQ